MFARLHLPSRRANFNRFSVSVISLSLRSYLNSTEPPFDRHDWIVHRPRMGEEVRYIFNHYSAPPLSDRSPAFSLNIRPAIDTATGVKLASTVERRALALIHPIDWSSPPSSSLHSQPGRSHVTLLHVFEKTRAHRAQGTLMGSPSRAQQMALVLGAVLSGADDSRSRKVN